MPLRQLRRELGTILQRTHWLRQLKSEQWLAPQALSYSLHPTAAGRAATSLYLGDQLTIVRNPKDELKTGTLHAMCKQLGITRDECSEAR